MSPSSSQGYIAVAEETLSAKDLSIATNVSRITDRSIYFVHAKEVSSCSKASLTRTKNASIITLHACISMHEFMVTERQINAWLISPLTEWMDGSGDFSIRRSSSSISSDAVLHDNATNIWTGGPPRRWQPSFFCFCNLRAGLRIGLQNACSPFGGRQGEISGRKIILGGGRNLIGDDIQLQSPQWSSDGSFAGHTGEFHAFPPGIDRTNIRIPPSRAVLIWKYRWWRSLRSYILSH